VQTGGEAVLELEEARREFWRQAAWGLVFGLAFNLKRFVTKQEKWKEAVEKAEEADGTERDGKDGKERDGKDGKERDGKDGTEREAGGKEEEADGTEREVVELLSACGDQIWWAVQVQLDLVSEMASHGVLEDVKEFCVAQKS